MSRQFASSGAAVAFFSLGILCFAINDALGKWLVTDYPVGQVLLLRTVGAGCFLIPMVWRLKPNLMAADQRGLHLVRVLVMALDTFAFYFATRTLPLADVMTFYLAAPLFITALSMLVLGEQVGAARWGAVGIGFVGVLIALRPSGASLSPAALIALTGSLMFATAIVITRKLRETHWLTLVARQFLAAGIVGAATSAVAWVPPRPADVLLMLLVGIVSMLCFMCINKALTLAHASFLAPFHYLSIVWAIGLGWLIWGDVPTLPMWIGIGLIVTGGLLVWYREQGAKPPPGLAPGVG